MTNKDMCLRPDNKHMVFWPALLTKPVMHMSQSFEHLFSASTASLQHLALHGYAVQTAANVPLAQRMQAQL